MGVALEMDAVFGDGLADTITYTTGAGVSTRISAVIDRGAYQQERTPNGMYLMKTAMLLIKSADIAAPDPGGDTVNFDGLEWGVDGFETVASNAHILSVIRRELINKRTRQ